MKIHKVFFISFLILSSTSLSAQYTPDPDGDAAKQYLVQANRNFNDFDFSKSSQSLQRVLLDIKNTRPDYQFVGRYKVTGNAYLYDKVLKGEVFVNGNIISKGEFLYDTYASEVLCKEEGNNFLTRFNSSMIDSFKIYKSITDNIENDIVFITPKFFNRDSKAFLQKLSCKNNYNIYRSYRSELHQVANYYSQTNFREFVLFADYYYTSNSDSNKNLVQMKQNKKWFKNNFSSYPLAINYVNTHSLNEKNAEVFIDSFFNYLQN